MPAFAPIASQPISTGGASVATPGAAAALSAALYSSSSLQATFAAAKAWFQSTLVSASSATANLTTNPAPPTMSYTPSAARTINIQPTPPLFVGGKFWTMTDPKKPRGAKDSNSIIDITFDWTDYLADIGNAGIASVTFTLDGLTSVAVFSNSTKATIFVSGGVIGMPSAISCKITTDSNPARIDERTVAIDVENE